MNVSKTVAQIEKIWNETFPDYILQKYFLDESIEKLYDSEKTNRTLVMTFSAIAVFIGCLGMYGLIRFLASQKTKEIGVRKAYGATVTQILYLFGLEILRLILVGFVIAAPVAYYLMNIWLEDYKNKINLNDNIIFLAFYAFVVTFLLAAFTIGYESYKAAQKNPSLSLKSE